MSNQIYRIINIYQLIKSKQTKILISNRNRSDQPGTEWWIISEIHPKYVNSQLDFFGILGLRNVIITDESKIINKILFVLKKRKLSDSKITLAKTNFSHEAFTNLTDEKKSPFCETVQDLFNFTNWFRIFRKVRYYKKVRYYNAKILQGNPFKRY